VSRGVATLLRMNIKKTTTTTKDGQEERKGEQ
jgi:hypothetical protein